MAGAMAAHSATAQQATPAVSTWGIWVSQDQVRFDERFEVFVGGLKPDEIVTIESSFKDGVGNHWAATATYTADDFGTINVSGTIPDEGMFAAADSMGLIWGAKSRTWSYAPNYAGEEHIDLVCKRSGEEATARVTRTFPQPLPDPIDVREDNGLIGTWFPPATNGKSPAIILIGGSEGGLWSGLEFPARLFQSDGYAVLILAYHAYGPLPNTMNRIPLEYFGQGIAWLKHQDVVDPDRIGMMGYSRGGEGSLLVASHYPDIRAVVCVAGGGLVFQDPWSDEPTPAWTWQGKDIPYFPLDSVDESDVALAEIPVERINGPVLLLSGTDDGVWESVFLSQFAWDRLVRYAHPHPNQFLIFPETGHSIMPMFQPIAPYIGRVYYGPMIGGTINGSAHAWSAAWAATKQHFATSLKF
jgi:dienelactone hydrolase